MATIVSDPAIRSGDPRIDGTRITVLDVKRRVIEHDEDPFAVATEYDIEIAGVFAALAYYYDHLDEMRDIEREQDLALQQIHERTVELREEFTDDELASQ